MTVVPCTVPGCSERAVTYPSAIGIHWCSEHLEELKHTLPEEI